MARIVKLNVGGTRYETSISTIMQHPNSMLGAMVQKPREQQMIESGEEIFIDRDGKLFKYILRYLRDGDKLALPEGDLVFLKQLQLETQFFSLDGLAAIIQEKLQLLTKDGWKVGDIVTNRDMAVGNPLYGSIGTIVQFRMDGKVAVQDHHIRDACDTMRFVTLKPK